MRDLWHATVLRINTIKNLIVCIRVNGCFGFRATCYVKIKGVINNRDSIVRNSTTRSCTDVEEK